MKIAFTSCTRYEAFKTQAEWNNIRNENPDYLFLLGDQIYMDFGILSPSLDPLYLPWLYTPRRFEKVMRKKYDRQFNESNFKTFIDEMKERNAYHAVWDDHDFGWNNARGTTMSSRKLKISTDLFHEYNECSTNYPHIYHHIDTPLARVIFLDNRTYKEKKRENSAMLGEDQFLFLEDKLEHNLEYTIICGGLTLTEGGENWKKHPEDLLRFCNLISRKEKVLFLGGDIHKNRFVKPHRYRNTHGSFNIPVQLISSGMFMNKYGLGMRIDNVHNWALLDIEEDSIKVDFYNGNNIIDSKKSTDTNFFNVDFT